MSDTINKGLYRKGYVWGFGITKGGRKEETILTMEDLAGGDSRRIYKREGEKRSDVSQISLIFLLLPFPEFKTEKENET